MNDETPPLEIDVNQAAPALSPQLTHRIAVVLILVVAFTLNAWVTWNKFGDLIVDVGRELDVPKQLVAGKVLYRDVRYWYGPFAPYLNAGLYRIFGVNQHVLQWAGLTSAAILVLLAYRVSRFFTGRFGAAACAAAVIYINLFGHYMYLSIFNFVMPYSYPATYGTIAAVGSLFFLLRFSRKRRAIDFLYSCGLLAIAGLCKVEVLFGAVVMHGFYVLVWIIKDRRRGVLHLSGYLVVLMIMGVVYGSFYRLVGRGLWGDDLFTTGNLSAKVFLMHHMGLEDVGKSFGAILRSGLVLGGCFLVLIGAAWMEERMRAGQASGTADPVASQALTVVPGALCCAMIYLLGWLYIFRSLSLFLVILLAIEIISLVRRRGNAEQLSRAILLHGLAVGFLAKMLLQVGAQHYGFYLAIPAVVAFGAFWCGQLPLLAAPKLRHRSTSAYCGGMMIMATLAGMHFAESRSMDRLCFGESGPRLVQTRYGTLPISGVLEGTVDLAIKFFETLPPTTKVVVIPEGAVIGFLAGATNPVGIHTFLPIDFCGSYTEASIKDRLRVADPDYIVYTARGLAEYGKKAFGMDYGMDIDSWIDVRYRVQRQFVTPSYRVLILGKR